VQICLIQTFDILQKLRFAEKKIIKQFFCNLVQP